MDLVFSVCSFFFFFSSRRRHTRCALVTGVQTCALPISAKQAGLDPATVKAAQSASDINAEIDNNVRLAQALQATGTPTWVVGDQVLSGAVGYDALKAAIEKARDGRNKLSREFCEAGCDTFPRQCASHPSPVSTAPK